MREFDDDWTIIDGIDVDHLEARPDELEHVAIEEGPDDELRALPFRESGPAPGYVEIDVDLMEYGEIVEYVETVTDYERRICFVRVPKWPPDGPTATGSPGPYLP